MGSKQSEHMQHKAGRAHRSASVLTAGCLAVGETVTLLHPIYL